MANTKRSTSRALRPTAPRKTTKPKTPTAPAPAYVSDYAVGDHISHPMFGDGTVTAIDQNKLTVEFPESVTKQSSTATQAPTRNHRAPGALAFGPRIYVDFIQPKNPPPRGPPPTESLNNAPPNARTIQFP
jgi:hypothetical protein